MHSYYFLKYKQRGYPASVEKEMPSASDGDAVADLMEQHDQFISSMQSRLAKLQVIPKKIEGMLMHFFMCLLFTL